MIEQSQFITAFKMFKIIILLNLFVSMHSFNICGDWSKYKNTKCFKIFAESAIEEYARHICQEHDSSLITIHDREEQEFVKRLLVDFSDFSFAWIGLKYNGTHYKWNDGTDTKFINWERNKSRNARCAVISLPSGKWKDVSCSSTPLIICQKSQESLKVIRDALGQIAKSFDVQKGAKAILNEIKSLKEEIDTIKSNYIPVGFIYTQLPDQLSPQQLWPTMKWNEVTDQYSGLFFRAEGSGSEGFGRIQQANQSVISSIEGRCFSSNNDMDYTTEFAQVDLKNNEFSGVYCVEELKGLNGLFFYTTTGEVRPKNTAIRIWKRIS